MEWGGAEVYFNKMKSKMPDKIDFLLENKEKFDTIIDIGCADASLLIELKKQIPSLNCIGYDIDFDTIEKSKLDIASKKLDISLTSNYTELVNAIELKRKMNIGSKIIVNMSSLLHEVFSYSTEAQQNEFMNLISEIKPDYIAIRDFYVSDNVKKEIPKYSLISKVEDKFSTIIPTQPEIFQRGETMLDAWENTYGKISESKESSTHLLLSCRYFKESDELVKREFFENYLSITDLKLKAFQDLGYEIIYKKFYNTNDFIDSIEQTIPTITKEEIFEIPETKVKLILKRKQTSENLGVGYGK